MKRYMEQKGLLLIMCSVLLCRLCAGWIFISIIESGLPFSGWSREQAGGQTADGQISDGQTARQQQASRLGILRIAAV